MTEYVVLLTWDDEASVWVAENDDIPIALESPSLDTLIERVKLAARELLELNDKNHGEIALLFKMERQTLAAVRKKGRALKDVPENLKTAEVEGLSIDDIPTFMEKIKGNYSLHGYIDAYNKMAMNEIFMHHRSSRVFEMIDDSYNMTMDLYKSIKFNLD